MHGCQDMSMMLRAGLCAAYVKATRTLELYKLFQPAVNHFVLELVQVYQDVRRLPTWQRTPVQVPPLIQCMVRI